MKQTSRFLLIVLVLAAVLFARIGTAAAAKILEPAGSSLRSAEVTFTGVIEKMEPGQWVIDGKIVTVSAALVKDGSFTVGDTVKMEGYQLPTGSIIAKSVEPPSGVDDNSNSNDNNSNDANSNDGNSDDTNINDDNSGNGNSNDSSINDNSNDDHNSNSNDAHHDDNSNGNLSNDHHSHDDNSNNGGHGHNDNSSNDNGNDNNSNNHDSNDDNSNNG
jgi:hypothetical protein